MSRRTAAWLAWSVWAVCVAFIALALLLQLLTGFVPSAAGARQGFGFAVLAGVLSLAYPAVGALIASRLPSNPIGWFFCSLGLLYAVQRVLVSYADYALNENFALPGGEYVAWVATWMFSAIPTVVVFLMLLFPQGRLTSRRWRIVVWVTLCGAALAALGDMFMPAVLPSFPYLGNPFGEVAVIGGFATYDLFGASIVLGTTLLAVSILAALLSLMVRLRRARGDERQQLKWFLYAAVPLTVFGSLNLGNSIVVIYTTTFLFRPVYLLPSLALYKALDYVTWFALLVVPVFTYIAILKYRLYDTDLVINRALVYGSLTALLAAVYFGGVTATQAIFHTLTGQEKQPQLAIVVSTLVIAALFNPLRRRIQSFMDRRFYRRKYDAAKTLEAFSAKLRDETDLDALSNDLVGVVRETMQPAHVSLWLRPEASPKGTQAG